MDMKNTSSLLVVLPTWHFDQESSSLSPPSEFRTVSPFSSNLHFIYFSSRYNRIWINWPRDRYASVPVIFHLDLAELSGRIRFGVERSCSLVSFLKTPVTRISVRSEVGGDKYKLKDIPQISDYIVKKIKKWIRRRIVHPHAHRFRLIWPRNWWPKGTENLFLPEGGIPGERGLGGSASGSNSPVPMAVPVAQPAATPQKQASSGREPQQSTDNSSLPTRLSASASSFLTPQSLKGGRAFDFGFSSSSSASSSANPNSHSHQHSHAANPNNPTAGLRSSSSDHQQTHDQQQPSHKKQHQQQSSAPLGSSLVAPVAPLAIAAIASVTNPTVTMIHSNSNNPDSTSSSSKGTGGTGALGSIQEDGGGGDFFSHNSLQIKEKKWLSHLKQVSEKVGSGERGEVEVIQSSNTGEQQQSLVLSNSSSVSSPRRRERIIKQFYDKQRRRRGLSRTIARNSHKNGSAVVTTPPAPASSASLLSGSRRSSKSFPRSYSLSDFRKETAEVILSDILSRQETTTTTGGGGTGERRRTSFGSYEGVRGEGGGGSKQRSNSMFGLFPKDDSSMNGTDRERDRDSNTKDWLKIKGREAKAKFLEFKQKHFGDKDKDSTTNSVSSSGMSTSGHVSGSGHQESNLKSSAARIGGKIKGFFSNKDIDLGRERDRDSEREREGVPLSYSSSSTSHHPNSAPSSLRRSGSHDPQNEFLPSSSSSATTSRSLPQPVLIPDSSEQPRSADVGFDGEEERGRGGNYQGGVSSGNPSHRLSTTGNTMKGLIGSMFRSTETNTKEKEKESGKSADTDRKDGRVNAMLSKALSSVRQQLDKDKEKDKQKDDDGEEEN
jgi:hypothetical protein